MISGDAAWAEPAAITRAKTEAEALQERIDELENELDAAVEDYNYATEKLSQTSEAIKRTQGKLGKAEGDLEELRVRFTERVVEIYKRGHLGMLDTLASATSFSDFIHRLGLLERLSAQDSEMIAQVTAYRERVAERKAELAAQLEEEEALKAETEAAKKKVEERLAANEKALAGKEAQIAQLEKEEAARQARLAAEAKRKAEEAARKAAAEAAAKKARAAASGNRSGGSGGVRASVPDSANANDVVSIAMKYLGSTYVWAGASPSGFDCSGLVMYAYAKVGVSLPHSSRMQYGWGKPVSRGELKPGDLVFFGNPIHHVGIYIGDGNMIHAAGTGKGVRINSVDRKDYYGACRIIL